MPFVTQPHRNRPERDIPGDRCYVYYKHMMENWRAQRRWTTADELATSLYPDPFKRAEFLAFLVFFIKHVMKYEDEKEQENGEI